MGFPNVRVTGSRAHQSSVTFTRPANTTAYTALDVIGIADTGTPANAGSAIHTFASIGAAGGIVQVSHVKLAINLTSIPAGMTGFNLYLFSESPTAILDNAAFALAAADRTKLVGVINLQDILDVGGFLYSYSLPDFQQVKLASGSTTLYGVLKTVGGFTPTSGEEYRIDLMTVEV